MKTKFLIIAVIVIGFSALFSLFLFETSPESETFDDREDLREVYNANNICSRTYRYELDAMIDDKNYDYKNDIIFQECSKITEIEKKTNTTYYPDLGQRKAILEYCIDSKDLTDTTGLSYSNNTHYIDTVTCEWMEFEINEKLRLDLLP